MNTSYKVAKEREKHAVDSLNGVITARDSYKDKFEELTVMMNKSKVDLKELRHKE